MFVNPPIAGNVFLTLRLFSVVGAAAAWYTPARDIANGGQPNSGPSARNVGCFHSECLVDPQTTG